MEFDFASFFCLFVCFFFFGVTFSIIAMYVRIMSSKLCVNRVQMNALRNLGLNVRKANVYLDSSGKHNKFAITKA